MRFVEVRHRDARTAHQAVGPFDSRLRAHCFWKTCTRIRGEILDRAQNAFPSPRIANSQVSEGRQRPFDTARRQLHQEALIMARSRFQLSSRLPRLTLRHSCETSAGSIDVNVDVDVDLDV